MTKLEWFRAGRVFQSVPLILILNASSTLISFLFIGYLARTVNSQTLAEWFWLISLISFSSFTDFYLHQYFQNLVTRQHSLGQGLEKLTGRFDTLIFLLISFSTIQAILIWLAVTINPLLFSFENEVLVVSILWLVGLIQAFQLPVAVLLGIGHVRKAATLNLLRTVFQYLGMVMYFTVSSNESVYYSYQAGALTVLTFSICIYISVKKRFFPSENKIFSMVFDASEMKAIYVSVNKYWFILRLADALRLNYPLVIGFFFVVASAFSDYASLSRLNLILNLVAGAVMTPLLPELVKLQSRQEVRAFNKLVLRVFGFLIMVGLLYIALMISLLDIIMVAWLGGPLSTSTSYHAITLGVGVLGVLAQLIWTVLISLERLAALFWLTSISTVLGIGIMAFGVQMEEWVLPLAHGVTALIFFCFGLFFVRLK